MLHVIKREAKEENINTLRDIVGESLRDATSSK